MANWVLTLKNMITSNRRIQLAATVGVCVGLLMFWPYVGETPRKTIESAPITEVVGEVMSESAPMHISIPSVSIEADFEAPLSLKQNGEIEVPETYDKVAYYSYGPTPGELGPSVILGHVDSFEGPAVFFSLGQLKEGDEIKVEREDGTIAVFAVTTLERHLQSGFPTREVYQDIDHAGLRLITCTGTYNHDILRYTHNLIVFADLVRIEGKT